MATQPGEFSTRLASLGAARIAADGLRADEGAVIAALQAHDRGLAELAVLLSPAGLARVADITRAAGRETDHRFGRTVRLFAPLYVSNACLSTCVYCGFAKGLDIKRRTLSPDQVVAEATILLDRGVQEVLLVSGEHRGEVSPHYLVECIARLQRIVPTVSIETQTWPDHVYQQLRTVGLDGVVHYQETYDRERYAEVHLAGWKRNFVRRLNAMEAVAQSGVTRLGVGALLGLAENWRADVLAVAAHARFLQELYPNLTVTVALPRINPSAAGFQPKARLSDDEYTLAVAALRLCVPFAGLVLSTREASGLRDRLVGAGVTHMSAEASTEPGGYSCAGEVGEQFTIADRRTVGEVREALASSGYELK